MSTEQYHISDLICFKNNRLLIANKPVTMPSQANRDNDKSLQDLVEIYTKRKSFILTRLDRPVSGACLFALSKKSAAELSEIIRNKAVRKEYLALVDRCPEKKEDHLTHYLKRNAKHRKSILNNTKAPGFKKAVLYYKVMHSFDNYHLLHVVTETGRFHQIRAQLAAINCHIKGDVKYGARRSNTNKGIHLHAWKLNFKDPANGADIKLTAPIPKDDRLWTAVDSLL